MNYRVQTLDLIIKTVKNDVVNKQLLNKLGFPGAALRGMSLIQKKQAAEPEVTRPPSLCASDVHRHLHRSRLL